VPRRRPFGDKLEFERDDAGVLGKAAIVERVPSPTLDAEDIAGKGLRAAAVTVEAELLKRSARTQQRIALGGGALATALAWLIRLLFAGAKSGLAEAIAIACAVLGPAAVVYALATFVWPEPAAVPGGSQLGSGTLDEAIRHRLWLVRVGACAIGVVHLVVIWTLT
jgi:hypothetical protein